MKKKNKSVCFLKASRMAKDVIGGWAERPDPIGQSRLATETNQSQQSYFSVLTLSH